MGPIVLPVRVGRDLVPSPTLVRSALQAETDARREVVRAGLGVVTGLAELWREQADAREPRLDASLDASVAVLADRTGLPVSEVRAGVSALKRAGLVHEADGDRLRLEPDVMAQLPVLARVEWESVRARVNSLGAHVAPALALVRELARGSSTDGEWQGALLPELCEATLYSRSHVSKALSVLERARIVERDGSARGLLLRLGSASSESPARGAPNPLRTRSHSGPGVSSQSVAETAGMTVEIGGARMVIAPGAEFRVAEGARAAVEIDGSGNLVVRITPVS
jgi:DNA-binding IclR family transcriptional regulator